MSLETCTDLFSRCQDGWWRWSMYLHLVISITTSTVDVYLRYGTSFVRQEITSCSDQLGVLLVPPNYCFGFGKAKVVQVLGLVTCPSIFCGPLFLSQIVFVAINSFRFILMLSLSFFSSWKNLSGFIFASPPLTYYASSIDMNVALAFREVEESILYRRVGDRTTCPFNLTVSSTL